MGLTQKLGTIPLAIFTDASNNIGIGGSPSGSYKFEVTGTGRFTGALTGTSATFSSSVTAGTLMNSPYYKIANANGISGYVIPQATWLGTGTSTNLLLAAETGNSIGFTTNGTTDFRMFINTSGNVGIGTSSPSGKLDVSGQVNVINGAINFGGSGSAASTDPAIYRIGGINDLAFAIGSTERLRITSDGNLLINSTNNTTGSKLYINSSSTNYGIVYQVGTTNNFWVYGNGDGYLRASAWSYGSDRRLKENINYIETGLDKVLQLKPATFDYIDGVKNNIGWIAQDVQEVIPEAVNTISQDNDQLTLKSDFIVPYLVKAIQELSAKVAALENK